MANIVGNLAFVILLVALCLCNLAMALPAPEDERYFDKQLNRELINKWLSSVHNAQAVYNNPCRYYAETSWTAPVTKRNSELINSLLSLPRSMNDAGK